MDATDPRPPHEPTDVDVVAVSKFTLGLTLAVILALAAMWFLFDWFVRSESAETPKATPYAVQNPRKEPPEPRLQTQPLVDGQKLREDENAVLSSYGWVDPDKKIVRIPIDRAIDIVAREGGTK